MLKDRYLLDVAFLPEKRHIYQICMYIKNNINDTSNKIIKPWQIIINFTICFFFQNVCMFFHVIETNSYCAAIFFSLDKKY